MDKMDQEIKACNAVILVMEKLKGECLTITGKPDKDERQKKAPDLLVRGISSEYVIEHTRIESFQQQIRAGKKYLELLKPLENRLKGKLPTPGHFELVIDSGTLAGLKRKEAESILKALETWVTEKAPTLKIHSPISLFQYSVCEVPTGVQFEVTLRRLAHLDGEFWVVASAPDETKLEEKRMERIHTALESKCAKLHEARVTGQVTVLILESDNFQLANIGLIGQAAVEKLSERDDIPDEVYLVETVQEHQKVWILKYGNEWFPDYEHIGPHYLDLRAT